MQHTKGCQRQGCSQVAITEFRAEPLCLEHFCGRSYQFLERISHRTNESSNPALAEEALTADECARRTIEICLTADHLNNLDRARLLDILLWCGDVAAASRPPGSTPKPRNPEFPYPQPPLRSGNAKAAFSD